MSLIDLFQCDGQNNVMRNITILVLFLGLSLNTFALERNKMRTFLVACGYGTAIGAAVGAGSLAFTDDPGSKLSNVAKGASLGLYAGIGIGLYLNSLPTHVEESVESVGVLPVIFPVWKQGKVDGAQVSLTAFQF